MKNLLIAALLGASSLGLATIATAQSTTPALTGAMSIAEVGVVPTRGLDGAGFTAAASDANRFQIEAGRLALTRAQRDDVKAYGRRIVSDSETAQKMLLASLENDQRKIAKPSRALSGSRESMLKLLRNSPKGSFDNLYLTQSAEVQQSAWATYKGYAEDGVDQSLKQVAGNGVPLIERQLQDGDALLPSSLAAH